jgi:hypothetical protein
LSKEKSQDLLSFLNLRRRDWLLTSSEKSWKRGRKLELISEPLRLLPISSAIKAVLPYQVFLIAAWAQLVV